MAYACSVLAALSKPFRRRDIEAVRKAKVFYKSCIRDGKFVNLVMQ